MLAFRILMKLAIVAVTVVAAVGAEPATAPATARKGVSPTSQQGISGEGKYLGCVWRNKWTTPESTTVLFNELFNQVTPEGAGKWEKVEKTHDEYYWTTLDAMYAWAAEHKVPVKEHNLVWYDGGGNGTPKWADALPDAEFKAEVEQWIKDWAARYGSRTEWIDVVNEAMRAGHKHKKALGGDGVTGYDWVIWCYETARRETKAYSPKCKLLLNDYFMLDPGLSCDEFVKLAKLLKERGLLDGIAEEGHFLERISDDKMPGAREHLKKIVSVGGPVHLSELTLPSDDDEKQLALYKKWFPLFWEEPAVAGVTLWGYYEPLIFSDNRGCHLVRTDGSERPALTWLP